MDTIETMRCFLAVAQEGSFTGGARRLGLSTKLVSKRVAALEERLDAQLFARTTRSVSLTHAGEAYRDGCRAVVEDFDALEATLKEGQTTLAGPIRITAPTGFGATHLPAALAGFSARHPSVSLHLNLSNARIALAEEGLDLAIRVGMLRDSSMIARRLGAMPLRICAAPAYLDRTGPIERPADLVGRACLIDENFADPQRWRFHVDGRDIDLRVEGAFYANAPAAIAEMAMAGAGVARCPAYVVEAALRDGRLVEVLSDVNAADSGLHILYPPNRRLAARVRALIDHLVAEFANPSWMDVSV